MAVLAVLVGLAGSVHPAIGSMVRARWACAATDADRLRSAFALESIIDELIFTIGPLVTAFLAFRYSLPLPLLVSAVIGLVGALVLAAQRSTEPPPSLATVDPGTHVARSALRMPGMTRLVFSAVGIGGVFGTYEVAVVAFTKQAGEAGASGIVLGLWAAGSMVGGLVFGSRRWRRPLPAQLVVLTGVMCLVLIPAPFVRTVPALAVSAAIAGAAVAPSLIALFSLSERLVPPRLLTEGLTWTNSGLVVGFAAGTTIGGAMIDAHGTSWAFVLPCLSAATSFVTAALGHGVLQAASADRREPLPTVMWNVDPIPGPTAGGIIDDPSPDGGTPGDHRGH
jgi:predicted MFS family arabinose efflux permease